MLETQGLQHLVQRQWVGAVYAASEQPKAPTGWGGASRCASGGVSYEGPRCWTEELGFVPGRNPWYPSALGEVSIEW